MPAPSSAGVSGSKVVSGERVAALMGRSRCRVIAASLHARCKNAISLQGGVCVFNQRDCHPDPQVLGSGEKGNRFSLPFGTRPRHNRVVRPPREPTMAPTRLSVALALVALGPAVAADPITRTDQVGDPLPPGAVARVGTSRFLPRPYLDQVFFSADGKTVLGHGSESVVDFWEAETGKPAGELRDP